LPPGPLRRPPEIRFADRRALPTWPWSRSA